MENSFKHVQSCFISILKTTKSDEKLYGLRRLDRILCELPIEACQSAEFFNFIALPLRTLLQSSSQSSNVGNDKVIIAALNSFRGTFKKFDSVSIDLALCRSLSCILIGKLLTEENICNGVTDRLVLEILDTHNLLWQKFWASRPSSGVEETKAFEESLCQHYCEENLPFVAHQVYVLLKTIEQTHITVQLPALASLSSLLGLNQFYEKNRPPSDVASKAIGDGLSVIFPGITITISSVLSASSGGGSHQNHRLPCTVLSFWSKLLRLILADASAPSTTAENGSTVVKGTKRSAEWSELTAGKVQTVFKQQLIQLCRHQHPLVRIELIHLSVTMLTDCMESLSSCRSMAIDVVASLSEDQDDRVRTACMDGILRMNSRSPNLAYELRQTVTEHLHRLCTVIPRLVRNESDEAGKSAIRQLEGYLTAISGKDGRKEMSLIQSICRSVEHGQRFLLSMIQSVEFDLKRCSITTISSCSNGDVNYPDIPLKFGIDPELANLFCRLGREESNCSKIDCDPELFELLLDYANTEADEDTFPKVLLLINKYLAGWTDGQSVETGDNNASFLLLLLDAVAENLEEIEVDMNPPDTHIDHHQSSGHSQYSSETISLLLLMQILGSHLIRLLDSDNRKITLLRTLFKILEFAGSYQPIVRETARITLVKLSDVLIYVGCNTPALVTLESSDGKIVDADNEGTSVMKVQRLIEHYNDYIMNALLLRMRECLAMSDNESPQSMRFPIVLQIVCRYSSKRTLYSLQYVIADTLRALDVCHHRRSILLLRALLEFTMAVGRLPSEERKTLTVEQNNVEEKVDHEKDSPPDLEEVDDEGVGKNEGDINCAQPVDENKENTPPLLALTVKILERTKHLLSSDHLPIRILLLEIVTAALRAVSLIENELLPMIHQNWAPVMARFSDDTDTVVALKAFKAIQVMAEVSGNFIVRRMGEQFIPVALRILRKSGEKSRRLGGGGSASIFAQSSTYKIQLALLSGLGDLIVNCQLNKENCRQWTSPLRQYLLDFTTDSESTSSQPKSLLSAAQTSLKVM